MTNILITGASSGLGAALAKAYAEPGVTLHICGRNAERLARTAEACFDQGAEVLAHPTDITDATAMESWIEGCGPLDLVIANAGISSGTAGGGETAATTRALFATNVDGVLNTVLPVIEPMRKRGQGQIAIVSSMAGFRGLPGAPAYSASKGSVRLWGEALRGWLAKDGVQVSVICPGFFESNITKANSFPMPMMMSAEQAADHVIAGLDKNKPRIAFPWPIYFMSWLLGVLPVGLSNWIVSKMPEKG